jgi:hypothetical protein
VRKRVYCPRCNQFGSDDLRFCPGCGLHLTYIMDLVMNNGLPPSAVPESHQALPLMRRRGVRNGAKVLFVGVFLIPIAIIFSIIADSPGPLAFPAIIFFIGLAITLYQIIFGEQHRFDARDQRSMTSRPTVFFPASHGMPIPVDEPRRADTSEMGRPPSVTEHTTRFLHNKK